MSAARARGVSTIEYAVLVSAMFLLGAAGAKAAGGAMGPSVARATATFEAAAQQKPAPTVSTAPVAPPARSSDSDM